MSISNQKKTIALLLANLNGEYVNTIFNGILNRAKQLDYNIAVFNSWADCAPRHDAGEYNIYSLPNLTKFDGIILFTNTILIGSFMDQIIERCRQSGVPAISIDRKIDGLYSIVCNNYGAMKDMVRHLVNVHGFTRINFIAGLRFNSDSEARLAAYYDVLRENNIEVEEERVYFGSFMPEDGKAAVDTFFASALERPQAVVCSNDTVALAVCLYLKELGIEIPAQIVVTGFDNLFEARSSFPKLTTINRPLHDCGTLVFDKMVRIMEGCPSEEIDEIQEAELVISESCGCVKSGYTLSGVQKIFHRYTAEIDHYHSYTRKINSMVEYLNASSSYIDFMKHIEAFVPLFQAESIYLCLSSDWRDSSSVTSVDENGSFYASYRTDGYAPRITVPFAYRHGRSIQHDDFPISETLPDLFKQETGGNCHLFLPLHFQDRCFGFLVFVNSRFMVNSALGHSLIMGIGNSLENIRKQDLLHQMLDDLDKMYVIDSLTGLYNRFGFYRYAKEHFGNCAETISCMILFADLDGLKQINDQHGHDNGDAAICAAADIIKKICCRKEICSRFGGDEYVIFAPHFTDTEAEALCSSLQLGLDHFNETSLLPFTLSLSYGYQVASLKQLDMLDQIIREADKKMYQTKRRKKAALAQEAD